MTSADALPVLYDYLDPSRPVDFAARDCTPAETREFVALHDRILRAPGRGIVDPQLVLNASAPNDAVAFILSPLDPPYGPSEPRRLVVALFCTGHIPGTPLADSLAQGREVTATVALDTAECALWHEEPLIAESAND